MQTGALHSLPPAEQATRATHRAQPQRSRSLAHQQHRRHKAAEHDGTTATGAGRHSSNQLQAPALTTSPQQQRLKLPLALQHQKTPVRRPVGSSNDKLADLLHLLRLRPTASQPALLTAAIKATSSWQQAAAVFSEHSHWFNNIHTAAFISHLPKVLSGRISSLTPQQQSEVRLLLQDISQLAEELLQDCSHRELANMAHGLASLGFYNRRLMQLVLCRCDLTKLKPQELSNLTWAVAKLGHEMQEGWVEQVLELSMMHMQQQAAAAAAGEQPGFSSTDSAGFKPQEICNIAWGLAIMQRRCLLHSAPPLRHRCTVVNAAWKSQFCSTVATQIRQCCAADVSMCLWSLAVLGCRGMQQSWLDVLLRRATELSGVMQARHIAVVLWAVSRFARQQQQQHNATAVRGLRPTEQHTGISSSSSLQHFASAAFPAVHQLLQVQNSAQQQQQQQHSRGQLQLVCVLLLSCAHLGLQPSAAVMTAMLAVAAQQLQAWTMEQQQQQHAVPCCYGSRSVSADVWHQWSNIPTSQQQQQQPGVTLHDVGTLLYGLARVSFHPGQHFTAVATAAAATAVCQQVLVPAAARRQEQHQQQQLAFPGAAVAAAGARVQGKELALLVWSLAKLHARPCERVLWLLRVAAVEQLDTFSSRDVAVLLWALGQMHDAPQFKWVRRMLRHFLARLDDSVHTAPDICQVLNALPCLPSVGAKNLHRIMLQELDDLLPQLAASAAARFGDCGARELVGVLQGFARLGYWPGCDWQQQHWQHCQRLQGQGVMFNTREQHILEHSRKTLARLGEQQAGVWGADVAAVAAALPSSGIADHSRHGKLAAYARCE